MEVIKLNNKELIHNELKRFGKARLIKSYCAIDGKSEHTIKTAFVRGSISKELAVDLESLTQMSALFWMMPDIYEINGEKR